MIGSGGERTGPAGARELIADYVEAGARHIVLAPIGAPSTRWVAEIIRPAAVPAHLRS